MIVTAKSQRIFEQSNFRFQQTTIVHGVSNSSFKLYIVKKTDHK